MATHRGWIRRHCLALALIASLVLSGCAAPSPATEPTARPPRLLETTADAGAPREPIRATTAATPAAQPAPTPQPARPVELAGLIDDMDDQGLRVGGTLVALDPATRLAGTPERGAWVLVRGDDDDDDTFTLRAVERASNLRLLGGVARYFCATCALC